MGNSCKTVVEIHKGERLFGHRRVDGGNVNICVNGRDVDRNLVVQNMVQWQAFVNTVMNLGVS
jgi:hypothetical protein